MTDAQSAAFANGFLIGCFLIMLYMMPALIAYLNYHRNWKAIVVLNVLLGWTFLGWVVALVWAIVNDTQQKVNGT